MSLFKNKYRIESIGLKGYDYSTPGSYFITICTKNREHYFGEIYKGILIEKSIAKIVRHCWFDLTSHYHNCLLDTFIIMPNHIHGIIIITEQYNKINQQAGSAGYVCNNLIKNKIIVETGLKPVSTRH